jgi:hypothetical protein
VRVWQRQRNRLAADHIGSEGWGKQSVDATKRDIQLSSDEPVESGAETTCIPTAEVELWRRLPSSIQEPPTRQSAFAQQIHDHRSGRLAQAREVQLLGRRHEVPQWAKVELHGDQWWPIVGATRSHAGVMVVRGLRVLDMQPSDPMLGSGV